MREHDDLGRRRSACWWQPAELACVATAACPTLIQCLIGNDLEKPRTEAPAGFEVRLCAETSYTNEPEHVHSRDLAQGLTHSSGETYAFVHVLNLMEGWAYCLDLPQPFGMGPASAHALALSPDGRWLYVADRSSGAVAVADAEQLVIRGVRNVGADTSGRNGAATVALDGRLLLSDASGVLVLAAKSLNVLDRISLGVTPTGLALGQDGQRLFVGVKDRLLVTDLESRSHLGDIPAIGLQRIEYVVGR